MFHWVYIKSRFFEVLERVWIQRYLRSDTLIGPGIALRIARSGKESASQMSYRLESLKLVWPRSVPLKRSCRIVTEVTASFPNKSVFARAVFKQNDFPTPYELNCLSVPDFACSSPVARVIFREQYLPVALQSGSSQVFPADKTQTCQTTTNRFSITWLASGLSQVTNESVMMIKLCQIFKIIFFSRPYYNIYSISNQFL